MSTKKNQKSAIRNTLAYALALTALIFTLFAHVAFAPIPTVINVQGKLTDINDNPRLGEYNFTIRIFTAVTGGTQLYTETQAANTTNGFFSLIVGSSTAITLPFDASYWVELAVNGETLVPRYRVGSNSYAFRANLTDFIAGGAQAVGNVTFTDSIDVVKYLNVSGGVLYVNKATGKIGINTTGPQSLLEVLGNVNVSGGYVFVTQNGGNTNGTIILGRTSDGWENITFDTSLGSNGKFIFSAPLQIAASSPAITFYDPAQPLNLSRQQSITFNASNLTNPISFTTGIEVNGTLSVLGSSPASIKFGKGGTVQELTFDPNSQEFSFSGGKLTQDFSNAIKNGGFESFSGGGGTWSGNEQQITPDEWAVISGAAYQYAPSTYSVGTDIFHGYNSLKLNSTGSGTGKVAQSIYAFRLQPNKTYSVGVWVKTNGASTARLNLTGPVLNRSFTEQSIQSPNNWVLLKGQFTTNTSMRPGDYMDVELKVTGAPNVVAFFDAVMLNAGSVLGEYQESPVREVGEQTISGTLRLRRTGFDRGGVLTVDKSVRTQKIEFSFGTDPGYGGANASFVNDPRYNWASSYATQNVFLELFGDYSLRMTSAAAGFNELSFKFDNPAGPLLTTAANKAIIVQGSNSATVFNVTNGTDGISFYVGALSGSASGASLGTMTNRPLRLFTNNTDRFTITNNGSVGIGMTTPGTPLEVSGTIKATKFIGDGSGLTGISTASANVTGNGSAGYIPKFDNATTIGNSQIYQNGTNIGVGTTNPSYAVDVSGTVNALNVLINGTAVSSGSTNVSGGGVANQVAKWNNGTNIVSGIITDDGTNIGINTTSPTSKLHILADDTSNESVTVMQTLDHTTTATSNGTAGIGTGLLFRAEDAQRQVENVGQISALLTNAANTSEAGALAFLTRTAGGALTERVRIDGAGNVGIGKTSPISALDVSGSVNATGFVNATTLQLVTGGTLLLPSRAVTSAMIDSLDQAKLSITIPVANVTGALSSNISGGGAANYHATWINSTSLAASTSVYESSGNIGIGTTTPLAKLHVAGNAFFDGNLRVLGNITVVNITTLQVNGSINPAFDNLFDVGNTTNRWRDAQLSRNVTIGTGLVVDTNTLVVDGNTNNVGIGTTEPAQTLSVAGTFNATRNGASVLVNTNGDVIIKLG